MTASQIAQALPKYRKIRNGWSACCPAHDDQNPSLSISETDGKVLVHCHAGCDQTAVVEALKALGLWPEANGGTKTQGKRVMAAGPIVATYDYTDEHGVLLYQICRREPGRDGKAKDFFQRYPDGAGGWINKKHPRQVLYHLREVLENPIIFVVEGEKDAETLREHGFVATTNAGGCGAPWLDSYTDALRGREVVLIPDSDTPGRERCIRIAKALLGNVARLRGFDDHCKAGAKDITEWFEAGHSECEFIALLEGVDVV